MKTREKEKASSAVDSGRARLISAESEIHEAQRAADELFEKVVALKENVVTLHCDLREVHVRLADLRRIIRGKWHE